MAASGEQEVTERGELRFAQLSDLHLGLRFRGGVLRLPADKAEKRRRELRQTLTRFVSTALEEEVDAALLPGDLFDSPTPQAEDIDFAIGEINRLQPVQTFIAAGNHDPYSRESIYNTSSALYMGRPEKAPRWGNHVHVFSSRDFATVQADGFSVTGSAYHEDATRDEAPLSDIAPPHRDNAFHLLLFHGSLAGPSFTNEEEPGTSPFTIDALERSGYDYAAVGHYHSYSPILDKRGRTLGAYSGSPLALRILDSGNHGFIMGTLRRGVARIEADLRQVAADPRCMHDLTLDVTGLTDVDVFASRWAAVLAPVRSMDMVRVRLTGRLAEGLRLPNDRVECFQFIREDETLPDYDLPFGRPESQTLPAHDVRAIFLRRMTDRWNAAAPEERPLIEEATRYGLDALMHREVTLR
jgi:DNA repair protein SbcD/Mre11